MQLMSSSKPSSGQTAGFLMKLLLTAPAAAWVFADHLGIVKAGLFLMKYFRRRFCQSGKSTRVKKSPFDRRFFYVEISNYWIGDECFGE